MSGFIDLPVRKRNINFALITVNLLTFDSRT